MHPFTLIQYNIYNMLVHVPRGMGMLLGLTYSTGVRTHSILQLAIWSFIKMLML